MPDTRSQVSIVIVTHNSAEPLPECLTALKAATSGIDAELIVVDNSSKDNSVDLIAREWPGAIIQRNDRNRGFARAANLGARLAGGEYLLLLNPDVTLDHGSVAALITALEADDKSGLVSGRLRFPDGSFQATCRRVPTISNILFSRGAATAGLFGRTDESHRYTLPDYEVTTEVETVGGAMVMVRRALFEKFDGFDERFFMYMEDTELSCRLNQSGYRNLFVPSAGGVHLWGRGSAGGRIARLWHHHMSVWKYFLKHVPNGFSVIVLPALLAVNLLLRVLVSDGKRRGEA